MLLVLAGLSLSVILASVLRRPQMMWQKALLLVAVMTFIAVCVAWGIEYYMQAA